MDDRAEVYGTGGVIFADLFRVFGPHLQREGLWLRDGKSGATTGWSFTMFEEAFNQGYRRNCGISSHRVQRDETPVVTGETARRAEIMLAAYESARVVAAGPPALLAQGEKAHRPVAGVNPRWIFIDRMPVGGRVRQRRESSDSTNHPRPN